MKPRFVHFAIREFHALRRSRALWVGMIAAGAIFGLIGPFGTDESLATPARVIYWLVITVITFATGYALTGGSTAWAQQSGRPVWLGISAGTLMSAAVIYGEVLAVNALIFGTLPRQVDFVVLGGNIFLIVIIVTFAVYFITASEPQNQDDGPRLLERLPVPVRGALISLSVTDHYVHVTTAQGTHMLLMRLSDAIAETAPVTGFQIHRSHWVAQEAIASVQRTSRGKSEIVLRSGDRLPVSRTYLPQLKEAGFVPGSGA